MQTKKIPEREQEDVEERDIELENIVGNLMIAQYQVDRLRSRLSDKIAALEQTKKDLHIHSNMVINGIKLRSN